MVILLTPESKIEIKLVPRFQKISTNWCLDFY
jgi:hypothetical protein